MIDFSPGFTLWSFPGLLVLPTLSRRGVQKVDAQLRAEGVLAEQLNRVIDQLDRLQDGEAQRPELVETIFHPVPSVANRQAGPDGAPAAGY